MLVDFPIRTYEDDKKERQASGTIFFHVGINYRELDICLLKQLEYFFFVFLYILI